MTTPSPFNGDQRGLADAFGHAQLSCSALWLRYFALGGDAGPLELDAYLNGLMPMSGLQHNMIALAINERLDELPPRARAPYVDVVREVWRPPDPPADA